MVHYPMRVAERALSEQDAFEVLDSAEYIVVSTVDEDGAPYGVPLSFALVEGKIYFHTTNDYGHKLDDFERDSRVCVTAVVDVEPCFVEDFMTTRYGSAMLFGRVRRIESDIEVRKALVALCMKYLPEYKKEIGPAIEREIADTAVWTVDVDSVSGKAGRWRKKEQVES